jgi:invasion protein IalB
MRSMAACLLCVSSIAWAIPAASEEATPPALTISRWTKFCLSETCFIGADVRTVCGYAAAAVFIEQRGEAKRTLRFTMPAHVNRERGAGIGIDQAEPIPRPFVNCYANGCMADYEGGPELVDRLKHGRTLALSAVDGDGSTIHQIIPLAGFAEAYDGPPTEPKVFEEQQGKLQEELQRRADEARKRLESGQEPRQQESHEQEPHKTGCPSHQ